MFRKVLNRPKPVHIKFISKPLQTSRHKINTLFKVKTYRKNPTTEPVGGGGGGAGGDSYIGRVRVCAPRPPPPLSPFLALAVPEDTTFSTCAARKYPPFQNDVLVYMFLC